MLDYRPDLDPRTPGLITDLQEMVPTVRGYRSSYAANPYTSYLYALNSGTTLERPPTAVFASRWLSTPGGIVIVGTNRKLSLFNYSTGFIDVSKAAKYDLDTGITYPYGEDATASFDLCAFGDVIIACHPSTNTQKRSALDLTIATLFSDLTDGITPPPKAATCCVASNFVFLGNCDTYSTVTGSPDILAWSAIGDHVNWAVNPAITQASYAQFNDTPGPITCVRPFRDGVLVFKASSMYLGRYVGAGTNSPIWDFVRVSDKVGCIGHQAYTDIDNAAVFVGRDDIYIFDGTRPVSITDGIRETLRPYLNFSGKIAMRLGHDRADTSVIFASANARAYRWNYVLNRWGVMSEQTIVPCQTNSTDFRTISSATDGSGVTTYTTSSNHSGLDTMCFISRFPYEFHTQRSAAARMVTGAIGKPDDISVLERVNPIFVRRPTSTSSVTLTVGTSRTPSDFTAQTAVTMSSAYRFDTLNTPGMATNFVQLQIDSTNDIEVVDLVPKFKGGGAR